MTYRSAKFQTAKITNFLFGILKDKGYHVTWRVLPNGFEIEWVEPS